MKKSEISYLINLHNKLLLQSSDEKETTNICKHLLGLNVKLARLIK